MMPVKCLNVLAVLSVIIGANLVFTEKNFAGKSGFDEAVNVDFQTTTKSFSDGEEPTVSSTKGDSIDDAFSLNTNWTLTRSMNNDTANEVFKESKTTPKITQFIHSNPSKLYNTTERSQNLNDTTSKLNISTTEEPETDISKTISTNTELDSVKASSTEENTSSKNSMYSVESENLNTYPTSSMSLTTEKLDSVKASSIEKNTSPRNSMFSVEPENPDTSMSSKLIFPTTEEFGSVKSSSIETTTSTNLPASKESEKELNSENSMYSEETETLYTFSTSSMSSKLIIQTTEEPETETLKENHSVPKLAEKEFDLENSLLSENPQILNTAPTSLKLNIATTEESQTKMSKAFLTNTELDSVKVSSIETTVSPNFPVLNEKEPNLENSIFSEEPEIFDTFSMSSISSKLKISPTEGSKDEILKAVSKNVEVGGVKESLTIVSPNFTVSRENEKEVSSENSMYSEEPEIFETSTTSSMTSKIIIPTTEEPEVEMLKVISTNSKLERTKESYRETTISLNLPVSTEKELNLKNSMYSEEPEIFDTSSTSSMSEEPIITTTEETEMLKANLPVSKTNEKQLNLENSIYSKLITSTTTVSRENEKELNLENSMFSEEPEILETSPTSSMISKLIIPSTEEPEVEMIKTISTNTELYNVKVSSIERTTSQNLAVSRESEKELNTENSMYYEEPEIFNTSSTSSMIEELIVPTTEEPELETSSSLTTLINDNDMNNRTDYYAYGDVEEVTGYDVNQKSDEMEIPTQVTIINSELNVQTTENFETFSSVPDHKKMTTPTFGDIKQYLFTTDSNKMTQQNTITLRENTEMITDFSYDSKTKKTTNNSPDLPTTSVDVMTNIPTLIESTTVPIATKTTPNNEITERTSVMLTTKAPNEIFTTSIITRKTSTIEVPYTDIPTLRQDSTPAAPTTELIPTFCRGIEINTYDLSTGENWIRINWTLTSMKIDDRCQLKINVTCNSTDDLDWVVSHQISSTDVQNYEPVSFVSDLSEYTNYSCVGELFIDVENELILSMVSFDVTTKIGVPSSVYIQITNVTDRSFILNWKRPKKIPGNLKNYYIHLKKKSMHYVRSYCSMESIEITIPFFSPDEDVYYNFLWAEPDYLYEIEVLAQNEGGKSKGVIQKCTTEASFSTEPLNVTTILHYNGTHCNDDDYNATIELNWELPCNTNGELEQFEVNVTEKVYLNDSSVYSGNERNFVIPKNENIKNIYYRILVDKLNSSCVYEYSIRAVTKGGLRGVSVGNVSPRTKDGCPSKPSKIDVHLQKSYFLLEWEEPKNYYGRIIEYNVVVNEVGPKHSLSKDTTCPHLPKLKINQTTNKTQFEVEKIQSNFIYEYKIAAKTSAGSGPYSNIKEILTKPKESELVRKLEITEVDEVITDEKYEFKIRLNFEEPCNTNGLFVIYTVEEFGKRRGYPSLYNIMNVSRTSLERVLEKPEYEYEFAVRVMTESFLSSAVRKTIKTSAAIPRVDEKKIRCYLDEDVPNILNVQLERGLLNEDNGEILNYAIFLFEGELENLNALKLSSGICNKTCPSVNKTTYPFIKSKIFRVTPEEWNPFKDGDDKVVVSIKGGNNCEEFCVELKEDTFYVVLFRGFTRNTYRDVFVSTKTGITSSSTLIILVSLIILVIAILSGAYLYSKRSEFFTIRFRSIPNSVIEETTSLRHAVPVKQFISYYDKIQNDPSLLRKQYEEIEEEIKKYKEESVHSTFALKPENKRKNRYTNILPYDEFRVKLNIDEDDEISSDYINASYIKGISGEIEYIATQGPLEHTCRDFWKMVIQENITVIVMVSQFVEKEKEKCFKYFPKNHENMMISEDLEVKCLTELQFDTYCIRTLLIKKDIRQYSVVHMQYLDWPDFGCPSGTYNMISFCEEVRDRIQIEKGLMAVHCSAGVGRTGTLISLDILLQSMKKEKEISVFECVMELRKQRTHMVQTEKQYVYIHTCLRDVLENSSLYSFDDAKKNEEHLYENIKNEKVRALGDSKSQQKESIF